MASRPAATQGQLVGGRWHLCCPAEFVVRRITADRAHVDERGGSSIRAGAGGGDRAASRRANPPGAGAGVDARVGEIVGASMEPPIVALSANGSIRPKPALRGGRGGLPGSVGK
jgi:hypothetical protein